MMVIVLAFTLLVFFPPSEGFASGDRVPSSPKSGEVIARVSPFVAADLKAMGLTIGSNIFVRIFKQERELELWVQRFPSSEYTLFRVYPICSLNDEPGPKLAQGDGRSPEGFYGVTAAQMNPYSHFHLSFDLGYPNAFERAQGRTGTSLMVHGGCVSAGCYAMTDESIEEIYALANAALRAGQSIIPVHAFPFRMTPQNLHLQGHRNSEWFAFWNNLKVGYDMFERLRRPPLIIAHRSGYRFLDPVVR